MATFLKNLLSHVDGRHETNFWIRKIERAKGIN